MNIQHCYLVIHVSPAPREMCETCVDMCHVSFQIHCRMQICEIEGADVARRNLLFRVPAIYNLVSHV